MHRDVTNSRFPPIHSLRGGMVFDVLDSSFIDDQQMGSTLVSSEEEVCGDKRTR